MFQADFFDGLSASAKPVQVHVFDDSLHIKVEGETLVYKFASVEVQAKLGSGRRIVDLLGNARLEAVDISELEAAMPSKSTVFWSALHYLENHLVWVLVSLVATVFAGWMFLQHGVPKLAEYVARATPPSIEADLGEQVLKGLDHEYGYFSKSKIKKARQTDISKALNKLCEANDCPQYQLKFRDGGLIGANAFALPGGIMVLTDGLVELAKNNTEIVAVLAHELGHVKQRHAFRQSIQGALSGLVLAAITGDVSSMASGLPGVLMQMQYSRQHETEADDFALAALQKSCLPPSAFAEILYRLQSEGKGNKTNPSENDSSSGAASNMFATHPDTLERIKPFLKAKQRCQ